MRRAREGDDRRDGLHRAPGRGSDGVHGLRVRVAWSVAVALASAAVALAPSAAGAQDYRHSIAAEPGGRLLVDLDTGSVEIEGTSDDEIEVEARATNWGPFAREMQFELSGDGSETVFRGMLESWRAGLGGPSVRVRIKVPEEHVVDVRTRGGSIELKDIQGDVNLRTNGGHLEVEKVEGDVDLATTGGSIDVDEVEGDLRARTSGGPIRVTKVTGQVRVRTSGGSIQLSEVGGPVTAHTSGGSITARFEEAPEGELETSGGSITAEFDEDASVTLEAKTSGGNVTVEHEITRSGRLKPNQVRGEINGGGPRLRLATSGGNITVRER